MPGGGGALAGSGAGPHGEQRDSWSTRCGRTRCLIIRSGNQATDEAASASRQLPRRLIFAGILCTGLLYICGVGILILNSSTEPAIGCLAEYI
ncbi:hypothetical protein OPV22_026160 [Ensete ventricosum]|uniref:Uncharacterized protein n=1 Tax=Ensete ventricosum TaxID=4639 RepID=A0AAV8Q9X5_ENSVE|nr:hypothetical protein OPV22_026160 [Ensete ventricosum]